MSDPDPCTTAAVAEFAEGVAMEPCECGCGYDVPDWPEDMQYAYHAGREAERQRIRDGSTRLTLDGYLVTGTDRPASYHVPARVLDGDGDA